MTGCLTVNPADPLTQRLGLGAVALRYQALGWKILATIPKQKRPHQAFVHGVHWASGDPAMVEQVWGRDPLAGIAVATGSRSGLLVVDLDLHGGTNGVAEFDSFTDAWSLPTPPGPWVQTPSGGQHRYYRLPPGLVLPRRPSILPGVDLQLEDSYVVAPPSRVEVSYDDPRQPGHVLLPYVWHGCPCEIPPAPPWMIDWAANAPSTGGGNGHGDHDPLPGEDELRKHGLPVGLRNVTLLRFACQVYRSYGSDDPTGEARRTIDDVIAVTDRAGFATPERERTIASARLFIAAVEKAEEREVLASFAKMAELGSYLGTMGRQVGT